MHTLKRCMAAMVALLALSLAMTARAELPDFTPLVEQASPAVVNISTRQKLPDRAMARGQLSIPDLEGLPPMFRDFLERSIPQVPRNPRGQQREAQSLGSGFIISNDGYILTNNHVVADADEILVRLSDRSEHKAKLVGADPRSDVAVLKIEAKNLPTLKLGDSNKLKVGNGSWPSVRRSASITRSPPVSSVPRGVACRTRATYPSSRPTWRSTRATPAVRC